MLAIGSWLGLESTICRNQWKGRSESFTKCNVNHVKVWKIRGERRGLQEKEDESITSSESEHEGLVELESGESDSETDAVRNTRRSIGSGLRRENLPHLGGLL